MYGRIFPEASWRDRTEFLDKGFGYCIITGNEFVSYAFSAAVSDKYVDIGVETNKKYRRLGFGKIVSTAMTEEIVKENKIPIWQCDTENKASVRLALSTGFKVTGKQPLFMVKNK